MGHYSRTLRHMAKSWVFVTVLTAALMLMGTSAIAFAAGQAATKMTLAAPPSAVMGDPIRLEVSLQTEGGEPVAKAPIQFYTPATFLSGASGLIEIGDAVSDDKGIAVFEYVSRQDGENAVRARYAGDGRYAPSFSDVKFTIEGLHQFYEPEAGIHVRFVTKWLLVGLIGGIWSIYLFVGTRVLLIALAPPDRPKY